VDAAPSVRPPRRTLLRAARKGPRVNLPAAGRRVLVSWVADIRDNPRYGDASTYTETEPGEYRHVARGGIWNDNSGRASYGVTKSDVDGCRIELKKAGIILTFDAVDAILSQAVVEGPPEATPEPVSAADRKAAQRARARAAGRCIVCCVRPAVPGGSTCKECGADANARRKAKAPDA
jgi:hypothetical protein